MKYWGKFWLFIAPLEQKTIKGWGEINNRRPELLAQWFLWFLRMICTDHFSFRSQRRTHWCVCRNVINKYIFCGWVYFCQLTYVLVFQGWFFSVCEWPFSLASWLADWPGCLCGWNVSPSALMICNTVSTVALGKDFLLLNIYKHIEYWFN